MKRPSKKDIKAAIEKLKEKPAENRIEAKSEAGKLTPKQDSRRIRKQGV